MALEADPPHLGDIGDDTRVETCDFAGTLHHKTCTCGGKYDV